MQSLNEFVNLYIDDCVYMKGLDKKSIKAYTIDMTQYLKFQDSDYNWFKKETIEQYIKMLYQKYKPKTAKRKIACLKAFFHYLELEDYIETSPFHKIKIKRREAVVLPKTIPVSIISKILNQVYKASEQENKSDFFKSNAVRDAAVIELMFATGIRVCELCTLLPDDIDLKSKMIKVHGKGSKERYIQITNKSVQTILKKYRKLFKNEIEQCGYLFVNNRGNRLSEQSVRFMIDKYAKQIGSEIHITPHMFRHTIATLLLEENVDIRYIQEILGHSSVTTTQIYTHISMNAQKKILKKRHPRNKLNISANL